ncbi:ARMT1-like domain-containing protein [Lamprobacter modestohalophilus]|uniref:damage-control phosphatase ARMT1 family protein n=1 Tax=Lamprobacter modestohalophilus TaxID=1064514 RepID=UPI002ADEB1E3|nr:ARMT1-like domain-containing protein [Lamprobacter modestohalophilus]MEA1051007.1 ARMT1-like domain-containing protein [Lamprobacter modestohalophilus]
MRIYLDCWPCFLRQALSAARRAGAPPALQRAILEETMTELRAVSDAATPPEMGNQIHRLVRERTQVADPYRESKQEATASALALLPMLRERVATATDPLATAVRIAVAGNIIDYGVAETFDLEATLESVLQATPAIDDLALLRQTLQQVDRVLYLADNAGETVFDRVLIEALPVPVDYVVKAGPVLNDATREEATEAGLDQVAALSDTGCDAMGTPLGLCSSAFRERFERASLIIAKGQANYETLSNVDAPICFLLQAKCSVIAEDIGVAPGSVIIKASDALSAAVSATSKGVG